jgi:glutamine amidotransferase
MVVVVDYGLGNLFSVAKAFEMLTAPVKISGEAEDIRAADRIVLPGIGAFGDGMKYLRASGLDRVLEEEVMGKKKPFLGICLGLQLLAEAGEEHGEHRGFGWIKGRVRKLRVEEFGLKVPHIGWNDLSVIRPHPLFAGVKPDADFYFVHSFQLDCGDPEDLAATATYGEQVTAAIHRGNIVATQFHPEKSQESGLKLLENFLSWNP